MDSFISNKDSFANSWLGVFGALPSESRVNLTE